MKYELGQKIYYTGDQANCDGWFLITEVRNNNYIKGYDMKEINGENRLMNRVLQVSIGDTYKGHMGTRFVTEAAYNEYYEAKCTVRA
jgi:hypothetical protein